MIHPSRGTRGMAVAPHALASQSALAVLREGGNALEAMVAAAAAIPVVYPHMNSIGGDSFWLVHVPGRAVRGIDACGAAARAASIEWYAARGVTAAIPHRGGFAANTVAGTISGWEAALKLSKAWGGRLPLKRLLADAIHCAENGIVVTASQHAATSVKRAELEPQPGFKKTFLVRGVAPRPGSVLRQPRLAATLSRLARAGLDDFYRGRLARSMARDLAAAGSPVSLDDFSRHRARLVTPLCAGALGRHGLQHPAADAGRRVAPDSRHTRQAPDRDLDHLGADYVHLAVRPRNRRSASAIATLPIRRTWK
jgi:gamma-glutamyltranspeptidase/glutathione hydrolase